MSQQNHLHNNFVVENLLRVAKKSFPPRQHKKFPLQPNHIAQIFDSYGNASCQLDRLRVAVLVVVSYAAFLRFSDITQIRGVDVKFSNSAVTLNIPKSKTDQTRQGQSVIIAASTDSYCPVTLLHRYMLLARIRPTCTLPIIRPIRKIGERFILDNTAKALSYTRAVELVKSALRSIGLNDRFYGLHSMRRGGATAAWKKGVPIDLIQRHGRWKSLTSVEMYLDKDANELLPVTQSLFP